MTLTTILTLTISLSTAAAAAMSQDIAAATQEMQKANYFTFVMLLHMAPPEAFRGGNVTFLMPNDKTLAAAGAAVGGGGGAVLDFLLRQSIPSALLFDHLERFPTGTMIPASKPGFMYRVSNGGRRRYFLGNVRVTSPNICTRGYSVRCHGVDGVAEPVMVPRPDIPRPAPTCGGDVAAPAPEVQVSRQKSSSRGEVIDLGVIMICMVNLFL
ncbi:FAS1 domain-containing protein SELMODRAFT_448915-like [Salvia hispanica]|uniref:FAS1 domain-containing protein SELMODRAFT_448915-like n=1 Tax=Salvia hispanica TaxID=49212 RepID=UPI002009C4D2|nr:FAS1 domain-containing protein SELMODRAFT_448915-like [Salvia hispanica]